MSTYNNKRFGIQMAILSQKTTLVAASIVVVAACAGLGGYVLGKQNSAPAVDPPKANTKNTALERATKVPNGALSPTDVAAKISQYIDKEVTIYGIVTQVAKDTYLVVGQEASKPGGVQLDLGNSGIDIAQYANIPPVDKASTPPPVKDAVAITGTVKQTDRNIVLVVQSVKE